MVSACRVAQLRPALARLRQLLMMVFDDDDVYYYIRWRLKVSNDLGRDVQENVARSSLFRALERVMLVRETMG